MNRKIKTLIVEDNPEQLDLLKSIIEKNCDSIDIAGSAPSVTEAIESIRSVSPELIFLDVEIIGGTGFDVLRAFDEIDFKVIFVTSHDRYAIRAIRFAALDFLLKPVDPDELKAAVKRAAREISGEGEANGRLKLFGENAKYAEPERIALPGEDGYEFRKIAEIVRCKAESNYTRFYFSDGTSSLICSTLKNYETLLGECGFFRSHNSHLLNLAHAKGLTKGKSAYVIMSDGSQIDLSSKRKNAFLDCFAKV